MKQQQDLARNQIKDVQSESSSGSSMKSKDLGALAGTKIKVVTTKSTFAEPPQIQTNMLPEIKQKYDTNKGGIMTPSLGDGTENANKIDPTQMLLQVGNSKKLLEEREDPNYDTNNWPSISNSNQNSSNLQSNKVGSDANLSNDLKINNFSLTNKGKQLKEATQSKQEASTVLVSSQKGVKLKDKFQQSQESDHSSTVNQKKNMQQQLESSNLDLSSIERNNEDFKVFQKKPMPLQPNLQNAEQAATKIQSSLTKTDNNMGQFPSISTDEHIFSDKKNHAAVAFKPSNLDQAELAIKQREKLVKTENSRQEEFRSIQETDRRKHTDNSQVKEGHGNLSGTPSHLNERLSQTTPTGAHQRDFSKFQQSQIVKIAEEYDKKDHVFKFQDRHAIKLINRSLWIFSGENKIRQAAVWLATWKRFDQFITLTILLNSLMLAMFDYSDRDSLRPYNQMLGKFDQLFSTIFILECLIKIIAFGFFNHKKAYLKDSWNWLDFFVVLVSLMDYVPNSGESASALKGLRTFRILRPLRSINSMPSMKRLIASMLDSIPGLFYVSQFLFFIFVLFGIFGTQQFQGKLYNRCRLTEEPFLDEDGTLVWPINYDVEQLCEVTENTCKDLVAPGEVAVCGNPALYNMTMDGEEISQQELISYGIITFDNVGVSLVTIFQVLTLEGWSQMMYNFMDTSSSNFMPVFYFCFLVLFGSFFVMNLILAVISESFGDDDPVEITQKEQEGGEQDHNDSDHQNDADPDFIVNSKNGRKLKDNATNSYRSDKSQMDPINSQIETVQLKEVVDLIEKDRLQFPADRLNDDVLQYTRTKLLEQKSKDKLKAMDDKKEQKFDVMLAKKKKDSKQALEKMPTKEQFEQNFSNKVDENQGQQSNSNPQDEMQMNEHIDIENELANMVKLESKESVQHGFDEQVMSGARKGKVLSSLDQNLKNSTQHPFEQTDFQSFGDKNKLLQLDIDEQQADVVDEQQGDYKNSVESLNNSQKLSKKKSMEDQVDQLPQRAQKNCLYRFFYQLCVHDYFSALIFVCIIFNTIVLAMDGYPIRPKKQAILITANDIFSLIFTIEMVIKLLGLGVKAYVSDGFNVFDGTIVIMTAIDFVLSTLTSQDGLSNMSGVMQSFRSVRLLRIIKLARSWTALQKILESTVQSLKDISNFSILLFLFIFIFSLLGMELFAFRAMFNADGDLVTDFDVYDLDESLEPPRTNFDSFGFAILSVFVVIIGEDWNVVMYNYVRNKSLAISLFFISLMVIGNFMLLSLFTALLLKNFETKEEDIEKPDKSQTENNSILNSSKMIGDNNEDQSSQKKKEGDTPSYHISNKIKKNQVTATANLDKSQSEKNAVNDSNNNPMSPDTFKKSEGQKNAINDSSNNPISPGTMKNLSNDKSSISNLNFTSKSIKLQQTGKTKSKDFNLEITQYDNTKKIKVHKKKLQPLEYHSLCVLGPNNRLRVQLYELVNHSLFDNSVLVLIVLSCMMLAIEHPLDDPNGTKALVLGQIDRVVSYIFLVECLTKIVVYGFLFNGEMSYLRNPWNILDFIIVATSMASLIMVNVDLSFVKSLRILRVLRPLRMISRNKGLQIAAISLVNSIPDIINLEVIVLFFFFLIAILGTTLMAGKFYYCEVEHSDELFGIESKWDCLNTGGVWVNPDLNFDNVFNSMESLFVLQSTEGWVDMMFNGIDAYQVDYNPVVNNQPIYSIFFIFSIIIFNLFFLNLFVGVVIDTFNKEKELLSRNHELSHEEREWVNTFILILKSVPLKKIQIDKKQYIRKYVYDIVETKKFEYFILTCILLNTAVLSLTWYMQDEIWDIYTYKVNMLFNVIFTIECVLKLFAYRLKYFKDGWNQFDFIVVAGTNLILLQSLIGNSSGNLQTQATLLRTFRIGRIFRIIQKAKEIKVIFNTLIVTLPALASVGLLLMLLFFMYSIIGCYMFSHVMLQDGLSIHANFQTFGNAFLLLFRISTGESWFQLMYETGREYDILFQCIDDQTYEEIQANGGQPQGCGNPLAARLYFLSFQLIISQIFLNIVIAIIIDAFSDEKDSEFNAINQNDIYLFQETWNKYDPEGKGFIDVKDYESFVIDLCKEDCALISFPKIVLRYPYFRRQLLTNLQNPLYYKFRKYSYYDTIKTFAQRKCEIKFSVEQITKMRQFIMSNVNKNGGDDQDEDKQNELLNEHLQKNPQINFQELLLDIQMKDHDIETIEQLQQLKKQVYGKIGRHVCHKNDFVFHSGHVVMSKYIVHRFRKSNRFFKTQKMKHEIDDILHHVQHHHHTSKGKQVPKLTHMKTKEEHMKVQLGKSENESQEKLSNQYSNNSLSNKRQSNTNQVMGDYGLVESQSKNEKKFSRLQTQNMTVKPKNKLQIQKEKLSSNENSESKNTLDKELDRLSQPNGNGTISSKRQQVILEQCDEMLDGESFSSAKSKTEKKAKLSKAHSNEKLHENPNLLVLDDKMKYSEDSLENDIDITVEQTKRRRKQDSTQLRKSVGTEQSNALSTKTKVEQVSPMQSQIKLENSSKSYGKNAFGQQQQQPLFSGNKVNQVGPQQHSNLMMAKGSELSNMIQGNAQINKSPTLGNKDLQNQRQMDNRQISINKQNTGNMIIQPNQQRASKTNLLKTSEDIQGVQQVLSSSFKNQQPTSVTPGNNPSYVQNSKAISGDQIINHPSMMKAHDNSIKDYNNLIGQNSQQQFKAKFQKLDDDFLQTSNQQTGRGNEKK